MFLEFKNYFRLLIVKKFKCFHRKLIHINLFSRIKCKITFIRNIFVFMKYLYLNLKLVRYILYTVLCVFLFLIQIYRLKIKLKFCNAKNPFLIFTFCLGELFCSHMLQNFAFKIKNNMNHCTILLMSKN